MRYREPFTLLRRKGAKVYYYRLASDPTRRARSTGKTLKHEAKDYVEQLLTRKALSADVELAKFLEPYYNWETCPHVTRLRAEKKQVGEQHVNHQRALLDKYVLTETFPLLWQNIRSVFLEPLGCFGGRQTFSVRIQLDVQVLEGAFGACRCLGIVR